MKICKSKIKKKIAKSTYLWILNMKKYIGIIKSCGINRKDVN